MSARYQEADLPLLDDDEELKISLGSAPRPGLARSVSDSFHQLMNIQSQNLDEIRGNDPEIDSSASRRHYISGELMAMGFNRNSVFALLKYCEVADLSSAIEMLVKTEHGWTHAYIPSEENNKNVCEICQEVFSDHLESKLIDPGMGQRPFINNTLEEGSFPAVKSTDFATSEWRQCNICMTNMNPQHEFSLSCGHTHCLSCIKSYLEMKIKNGEVLDLKCPQGECEMRFTKADLARVCEREVFEKYVKFCENIEVNLNRKLKWCPAPNCGRTVEGDTSKPHVVCECGFHMCFRCGEKWHHGSTCAKNFQNLYSLWAHGRNIQRCPNCNIRTEKNEGCNHMTCPFCKFEWCWICGGAYSHSHFNNFFFGCPLMQFTSSDWSLCKIALVQCLVFLLWPLIFLISAFCFAGRYVCKYTECLQDGSIVLQGILAALLTFIVMPLVYVVMLVPTMVYRGYNFLHVFVRIARNS